jgi:hypothetical protein
MECAVQDCPRPGAVEAVVHLSRRPGPGRPAEAWEVHDILAHLCRGHAMDGEPIDLRRLRLGAPFLSYRGTPGKPKRR